MNKSRILCDFCDGDMTEDNPQTIFVMKVSNEIVRTVCISCKNKIEHGAPITLTERAWRERPPRYPLKDGGKSMNKKEWIKWLKTSPIQRRNNP